MSDIIKQGSLSIEKSRINADMMRSVTRRLIDEMWKDMLAEVPYASKAINLLEGYDIYDEDRCLVSDDDPVLKPDHTAARGFVDTRYPKDFSGFNPLTASYEYVQELFDGRSGTALQVVILQMLGARLAEHTYQFEAMYAQGNHLYFEDTGDLTLDHTKHFVSCQDISLLDPIYRDTLEQELASVSLPISKQDWESLQQLYQGNSLGHNELASLVEGLSERVFSRMWELDEAAQELFANGAKTGEKPLEYAHSTLLRGSRLNHGTWRVSDILRGQGVLYSLNTNPIAIRGLGTKLEQTAGMAARTDYVLSNGKHVEGPGAFLEIASRPYMELGEDDLPLNPPKLYREAVIEIDESKWQPDKCFIGSNGAEIKLKDIKLLDSHGHAHCYEGFKEENAEGIFFAAGGSVDK